jgi:hypothetical protein
LQGESSGGDHQGRPQNNASAVEGGKATQHGAIPEGQTPNANQALVERIDRSDRWMIGLTAVIAVAGIASAGIFGWQLSIMSGQLDEMKSSSAQSVQIIDAYKKIATATIDSVTAARKLVEATTNAVKASQRLAEAAEKANAESTRLVAAAGEGNAQTRRLADAATAANEESRRLANNVAAANEISRKALLVSQRPFMFPTGVDLVKVTPDMLPIGAVSPKLPHDKSIFWLANIMWENSGNTPTSDLIIKTYCLMSADVLTEPYNITKVKKFSRKSDAVFSTDDYKQILVVTQQNPLFGPKQSDNGGVCPITAIDVLIASVVPGIAYHHYIFGNATYGDLIETKTPHRTDFCYELLLKGNANADWINTPGQPAKVSELKGTVIRCASHNCADGECERQDREAKRSES